MKRVIALALITFLEGIRNRSVFGVALFSLFIFGLNVAVAGFFMRDIGKVTVDMNLSALSFAGLLLVFFVAINLMAKDIDKKTIHLVLSKPISRIEYIFGKFFGIQFFVFVSLLFLFFISCATIYGVHLLYPQYFGQFSWNIFFIAGFFVFMKISVLCSLVVFFSTITTSSFITLIFSISIYIVGVSIEEVVFYLKSSLSASEVAGRESLGHFIEFVSYIVPNFSVFDFKMEAAHGLPITLGRIGLSLGYATTYMILALLFAAFIFRRREFN